MNPAAVHEWAASAEARLLTIQFKRVERLLDGMPGADRVPDPVQAQVLGVDLDELEQHRAALESRVRDAVGELEQAQVARVRDRWAGKTLACYGDSITADRQSWAEVLGHALAPNVRVANLGRSGDSSADLIARFQDTITPLRPDLVLVMIGTNDARRFTADLNGESGYGSQAVADRQTALNIRELNRLIHAESRRPGLWLTPPPVLDGRIRTHPSTRLAHSRWSNDELAAKADVVRQHFPEAGDTEIALANHGALDGLLLEDGLHPNLAGQIAIAKCALALLDQD